ncbi:alpha-hydroxy acid oxidase [Tatumella sp. UBA2305]|uniref:alpha-hydroxy acid oxidase n=1 Tax=Tatumella sp. UBA2305 TaxID=1947647 RepID=UPI0025DF4E5F|nr:alpha-hydroxy acid oxidase [Tatumella sp. UBA2305]
MNLEKRFLSLRDFENYAKRKLPKPLYAYVSGGVEDNISLKNNLKSFSEISLIPEFMNDVSKRSTETKIFGHTYASPVGIAPMGIVALSGYQGDLAMAEAAKSQNVPFILSGSSLTRMEEIAEANENTWFQAYLPKTNEQIELLIKRVHNAHIRHLVITVDVCLPANRENNIRAGFSTPFRPSFRLACEGITHPSWLVGTLIKTILTSGPLYFENNNATRGAPLFSHTAVRDFSGRSHLTWQHIELIRNQWKGPLIIKGILSQADAVRCREIGVDGVIVSNHGGRQLDTAVSPVHVLQKIKSCSDNMVVMSDSGIRRGTDIIKSLAMGSQLCFIGRPFNYACTVGGKNAVEHAIKLIASEVNRDLGMLGLTSTESVSMNNIYRRDNQM